MDEAPEPKRKKELTGNEIIGKLKANENDVSKAPQKNQCDSPKNGQNSEGYLPLWPF